MQKMQKLGTLVGLSVVGVMLFAGCKQSATTADNSVASATPAPTPAPTPTPQVGVMVGGALMTPDKNIVQNAMNASNVTSLVMAVKAAGLTDTLSGAGPFTVFAPTDDAFGKLPKATVKALMKPSGKAKLTKILKFHVVAGRYTTADLKDGQVLTTLEGDKLTISLKNGQMMVNGATVVTPDVVSSNGVTFVIDTVLMPKK